MGSVVHHLASGQLTPATIVVWTLLSVMMSIVGGAAAGVSLAGKDLGNGLAALMGAMYGPVAAVPGILLALIALTFI